MSKKGKRKINFVGPGNRNMFQPSNMVPDLENLIENVKKQAYEDGLRAFKDKVILNIDKDINWIGKKRSDELSEYFQKQYMDLKYNKGGNDLKEE